MTIFADAVDRTLEMTIVPSFTRIGYAVRSRLDHWTPVGQYDLTGRVVVITGATSGLGLAATRALVADGATVEIIARDATKAAAVCEQLRHGTTSAEVGYVVADTGDLDAVRKASDELSRRHGEIHALIHNAGALDKQYGQSPQGIEHTVASQVLGPFLLTGLLLPQLRATPRSRVLWVSSGGMYSQPLSVAALQMGPDDYDGTVAYARAKRAQVTLAQMWAEYLRPDHIAVHAMHPGWADTPGVRRSLPTFRRVWTAPTQSRSGRRHPRVARRRRPHTDRDDRIVLARSTTPRDPPRVGNTQIRHRGRTAPPLGLVPCSFRNPHRDRGVVRIAIVGTGVSGLVAAHALHRDHEVTVYEADTRVGGHANTVDVEVGGVIHAVDTGFIVYNEPNYPGFTALLRELGVETQPTEMSFSVTNAGSGLEYRGSNLNTLFAQRRNLTRPSFLRLVTEIVRFNRAARRLVVNEPRWQASDRLPTTGGDDGTSDESIESFLRRGRYSQIVRGAVPRSVRQRDLVSRSVDVHALPDAFLRAVHAQPRTARPPRPHAVAHDQRRLSAVCRPARRAVRRSDPARDRGAQGRRRPSTAPLPRSRC